MRFIKGYLTILKIKNIIDKQTLDYIEILINNNATVYLVGGAIRNYILDYPINDYDFEIYNITYEKMIDLINVDKYTLNDKFKSIRFNKNEMSLARYEEKTGIAYTDYKLDFTNIKPESAVLRRDFTINSLMYCFNDNTLYDYTTGLKDLDNSILKAVDYTKFKEDSIRVLRLLKYQSSYNLKVDSKTKLQASTMSLKLWQQPSTLCSKLFKQIITAKYFNPNLFLEILNDFFSLDDLKNYESTSVYHPEKTLYNHLLGCLYALELCNIKNSRDYTIVFWAVFFHDFGKLLKTDNHALSSVEIFDKYSKYLVARHKDITMIKLLIENHMCIRVYAQDNNLEQINNLKSIFKNQLYLLKYVGLIDYSGRVLDFDYSIIKERMVWYEENILTFYKEQNNG